MIFFTKNVGFLSQLTIPWLAEFMSSQYFLERNRSLVSGVPNMLSLSVSETQSFSCSIRVNLPPLVRSGPLSPAASPLLATGRLDGGGRRVVLSTAHKYNNCTHTNTSYTRWEIQLFYFKKKECMSDSYCLLLRRCKHKQICILWGCTFFFFLCFL